MKLYRFEYSCYARKVQAVLDLLGGEYTVVDVPYGERSELVAVTGGYIQVPVLVDDDGSVVIESRTICERLLDSGRGAVLAPAPWDGPIWAYADWCDTALEDVLFRLAAPGIRRRFESAADAALFTFIKERKFGRGCVDAWERGGTDLAAQGRQMLAPTGRTLAQRPFIFGERPTLGDAALYGLCVMLRIADPKFLAQLNPRLPDWMARLDGAMR